MPERGEERRGSGVQPVVGLRHRLFSALVIKEVRGDGCCWLSDAQLVSTVAPGGGGGGWTEILILATSATHTAPRGSRAPLSVCNLRPVYFPHSEVAPTCVAISRLRFLFGHPLGTKDKDNDHPHERLPKYAAMKVISISSYYYLYHNACVCVICR